MARQRSLAGALAGVEGWLALPMAWTLHETARRIGGSADEPRIVEIGCWKGRSTIALATGLRASGGGVVIAVDPHTGSEQTRAAFGGLNTWEEFQRNLAAAGVTGHVRSIKLTAHEARPLISTRSVHLLLIDASRGYLEFREYLEDWASALADGALVLIRGPFEPGVYRVVREALGSPESHWGSPSYLYEPTGEMLMLRFRVRAFRRTGQDRAAMGILGIQYLLRRVVRSIPMRQRLPAPIRSVPKRMVNTLVRLVGRSISGRRGQTLH